MGCGNSTATSTAGGTSEAAKDVNEEPSPDDEKRRNYGGVYVGLPADLTNVGLGQSASTHKGAKCYKAKCSACDCAPLDGIITVGEAHGKFWNLLDLQQGDPSLYWLTLENT
ncbi:overexpressed in colon carcinoma 1 protein homolog [Chanos chanos]|uniref:Overexpressed in colon carcinoma 1 protein homolog n=1 Tax=Chanos chanos TaxID=29144 RepID=A0A6J2X0B1_CHACN|nr:overexpressed in colon carcinoma 1 protein [Chanos chanos]